MAALLLPLSKQGIVGNNPQHPSPSSAICVVETNRPDVARASSSAKSGGQRFVVRAVHQLIEMYDLVVAILVLDSVVPLVACLRC